jgi:Tfp pilus assembly protein PilX
VIARLRDQSGQALVLGLMTMAVLATLTTAVALEVTVNHRSAGRSADADKAFAIAQLGLSYAEGRLYAAAAAHTAPATGATAFSQDGSTGTYSVSVAADGTTWTMTATATYQGITKTVSAQANVPSPVTVNDGSVWNYLYADSTSGCTSLANNTIITVPIFIRGNLCMSNSAQITGTNVEVGGNITFLNTSSIGASAASKIDTLQVSGTCNGVTPGTGTCDGNHSPVWANHVQSTLSVSLSMPSIDLGSNYLNTNPGPATGHACLSGYGVPANFFDNDTVQNNSVTNAATNLFPNSDYDCKNASGTSEIAWNHSTNTLTLSGSDAHFYFDGNLTVGSSTTINYVGKGTLYFSGTVAFNGSSGVCGITNCTSLWNPDVNGMVLVAGCWQPNTTGGSLVTFAGSGTYCMDINTTKTVQFGSYVVTDYRMRSGSNMGPVLANTLTLTSGSSSLIPFHYMPPGTPLNSQNVYLPATSPTNWSG